MKKYHAPEAELLCFRPVEDLAIDFGEIWNVNGNDNATYGKQDSATASVLGDIKVTIK